MELSPLLYKLAICSGLLAFAAIQVVAAERRPLGFGSPLTADELKPFDIDVRRDGAGLPPGRGTVKEGEAVFAQSCAACHGDGGEQPISASLRLTGGKGTLTAPNAVQTVGSYWPFATTLYDYIGRAMPFNAPQSLSPDQVYAVTAYVLHLNGIVPEDAAMDAASLPKVLMPNKDGFESAYKAGK
jgi:mono/diheme cytochrome c family protein